MIGLSTTQHNETGAKYHELFTKLNKTNGQILRSITEELKHTKD